MTALAEAVLAGNRRALSRLLTHIENENPIAAEAVAALFPHTGQAHRIGITGAPGTGKSTLVAALAAGYRQRGQTVAVLAVDPTSPFTGGAVLGDRIRMGALAGDKGVFVRSVATRGNLGGITRSTRQLMHVLDAAGYDRVIVETVGAGQSEVEVVDMAHTTVVVEAPGLGDSVQAIKAGILEIADVLVINKADLPGAVQTRRALQQMLELGHPTKTMTSGHHGSLIQSQTPAPTDTELWLPPLLETVSPQSQGIDELIDALDRHREYLQTSGLGQQHQQQVAADDFFDVLKETLFAEFLSHLPSDTLAQTLTDIQARKISPKEAVDHVLHEYQAQQ